MKSKVNKSEMKKENPSHSFTEGHQLSEEEKKPFLTEEYGNKLTREYKFPEFFSGKRSATINEGIAFRDGFNTAAEKANARIDELGKLIERAFVAGRSKQSWESFKKENGL